MNTNSIRAAARNSPTARWLLPPLVLISLVLVILIVRDGLTNWAVENRRGEALKWAPYDSRALADAADDAIAALKSPAQADTVVRLAQAALVHGPTEMDALRDIGLVDAVSGHSARAFDILSLVAARTPLDQPTHLWLMKHRLLTGDNAGAFEDADDLLRRVPANLPALAPDMIAYAGQGAEPLTARLATNPPWRTDFLTLLAGKAPDPAVAVMILGGLARTKAPPTDEEVGALMGRRLADHAYQTAYLDWLKLLPPAALSKVTTVYDGNFEGLPGARPFNWTFGSGIGGEAVIGPSPNGAPGGALDVKYDGYATPDLANQFLALAPGAYRLTGLTQTTGDADDALAWTIQCAEGPNLTPTPFPTPATANRFRDFSMTFTVPSSGCEGQWLRLIPLPAEHQRTLEVWYRNLAIHLQ